MRSVALKYIHLLLSEPSLGPGLGRPTNGTHDASPGHNIADGIDVAMALNDFG
jgi:hypothetical protein